MDQIKLNSRELEQKLESFIEKNEKFRPKKRTNKFEFLISKEKSKLEEDENKKIVISGIVLKHEKNIVFIYEKKVLVWKKPLIWFIWIFC